LLGGELKVQSKENQGSKFYFEIPIKKGKEENHIIDSRNMKTKNIKILLAEDNKANQMFMKIIFKKLNIDFEIADNGKDVIKLLKQNKQFDIILMDINMPVLDGIEATKIVRDMKKDIPIIALTASVLKDEKDRYMLVGMNDVLEKPLDIEKLKKVINTFLN
jgi:CheY-like chemotaxis protein